MDKDKLGYYLFALCALLVLMFSMEDDDSDYDYSSYKSSYSSSYNKSNNKSNYSSSSSSSKKSSSKSSYTYDSYNSGYEDVMENDDFDWDRYENDLDYENGVDDAIDDYYDEFGEDWD